MVRAPGFAGVILAAGESSRMGRDKALLPWPPASPDRLRSDETFLSAAIRLLSASTDIVLVVVGKNKDLLAPVIYSNGASLVENPEPARGQFSSLQTGLQAVLDRGRDAAIVTLVDRPPADCDTVNRLRQAFIAANENTWAVVPEFAGKHGHPYVIGREMITVFQGAPATSSARDIEHEYESHIQYLAVNDHFVSQNINTPEQYSKLADEAR